MFEIEKGVAFPGRKSTKQKYPFPDMLVGDSFIIAAGEGHNARSAAWHYGNKRGWKFTTRTDGENVRIWRIE